MFLLSRYKNLSGDITETAESVGRRTVSFSEITSPHFQPVFNEVDIVGIVVRLSEYRQGFQVGLFKLFEMT